jgi:heme-degrading monooxygenase HmoA
VFARVTTFQGDPDSVDGPIRFPVREASRGVKDLPGFLAMFDFADRDTGRAIVVTLWETKEARDASSDFARDAIEKVLEAGGEQVLSVREYEVGHYIFSEGFRTS